MVHFLWPIWISSKIGSGWVSQLWLQKSHVLEFLWKIWLYRLKENILENLEKILFAQNFDVGGLKFFFHFFFFHIFQNWFFFVFYHFFKMYFMTLILIFSKFGMYLTYEYRFPGFKAFPWTFTFGPVPGPKSIFSGWYLEG